MNQTVFCKFLKKEATKQKFQVYPGILGKKIYNEISEEAWKLWMTRQTILINEKKLNMFDQKDQKILKNYMKNFLFNQSK